MKCSFCLTPILCGALLTVAGLAAHAQTATVGATGISSTAATLQGSANPGGRPTFGYLRWGLTASYGQNTAAASLGSGSSPVPFSAPVTGLAPATLYHFQAVATNTVITNLGADKTFMTQVRPGFYLTNEVITNGYFGVQFGGGTSNGSYSLWFTTDVGSTNWTEAFSFTCLTNNGLLPTPASYFPFQYNGSNLFIHVRSP